MGIIQAPAAEKKRWDKEDPAEIRKRKREKALARGEHYSDSYDEETDHEGDDLEVNDYGNNDSTDLLGGKRSGKDMMSTVQAARNKALGKGLSNDSGEIPLPCPEGYDPLKWASMSRKEKMAALGISEAEWNKMTRE